MKGNKFMKRLKTFGKYIICLILFYIFSHTLIFIGLNATYKSINLKGNIPESITVKSAQATSVNGEIKGNISDDLNSKYVKFNFYTDIDTLAGSHYINTSELQNGNFEFYFKLNYIQSYSVELTDEIPETASSENFSLKEYKSNILLAALVALIFI